MPTLSVAISPCPNDVVIFGPWLLGRVGLPGHRIACAFEDVETLNEAAIAGAYDVVKISAAVAARIADTYTILPSGAAFGFGAGPKLVMRQNVHDRPKTVAVPGLRTTAATLLRAALTADSPELPAPNVPFVPVRYDRIIPALAAGRADAGLLIHESALAANEHGLRIVLDLGRWWQDRVPDTPIPLGVIAARTSLGRETVTAIGETIRRSLLATRAEPKLTSPLARLFAREKDPAVIEAHIRAYVGELSLDMGTTGATALKILTTVSQTCRSPASGPLPGLDHT